MKIYTQILLGMAVGAVIGLTLGPKSSLLEHDLYRASDGVKYEVLLDRQDATSRLQLPKGINVDFVATEVTTEEMTDKSGNKHTVSAWVKGSFVLSEQMLLRDNDGALVAQLPDKKPGDRIEGWLRLRHVPLDTGVQSLPIP